MMATHVLDNRRDICSLKFQVYLHFGIAGYDDAIAPFLKAEGSNDFNTIRKAPVERVLFYCGLDALYTKWLEEDQVKEFQE